MTATAPSSSPAQTARPHWLRRPAPVSLSTRAVALLCLGPVHGFYEEPMLARERWACRAPLASVVFDDGWGRQADWLDRA